MMTRTRTLISVALAAFLTILLRNAWLCDDAYITFRTVDNFVNGYGLRWNTFERVQAYTHPLWMFILSGVYFFTNEIYFSSIFLSVIFSGAALYLVGFRIAASTFLGVLAIGILSFSKAFIDYSTSGLENALTHFILAFFFWTFFSSHLNNRTLFRLSFIASLGVLTRMDTALLYAPTILYCLWRLPHKASIVSVLKGMLPFVLWEAFSLFYYGFLFPNTAYAKLGAGIPQAELSSQGVTYFISLLHQDPLTFVILALGLFMPFIAKGKNRWPLVSGMTLYLIYIVLIGGDFMAGRFFTAPLFCAVIAIVSSELTSELWEKIVLGAGVVGLGLASPYPPPFSGKNFGIPLEKAIAPSGIALERGFYYPSSGLLKWRRGVEMPVHTWVNHGREMRRQKKPVVFQSDSTGFMGFFGGPKTIIIDTHGLADPFLSRLPANQTPRWRIGHFKREIPAGYYQSLLEGKNLIADAELAEYYEKLRVLTQGDLFSFGRAVEIVKFNAGAYDSLTNRWTKLTVPKRR